MTKMDQDRAAAKINFLAHRNSWPLLGDPGLNFVTPQLKTAFEIWSAKRGARPLPARSDFSLRDLKLVLSNLAFLQIVQDGGRARWRARLVGTALDHFMGGPVTGLFLDEAVPARFAEKWLALWAPAVEDRTPTRTVGRVEFADKKFYVSEAFHAPLAEDGHNVDTLMLVAYFHFTNGSGAIDRSLADLLMRETAERSPPAPAH